MQAKDIRPIPIIDKSDIFEERFNALLKVVQEQEERIKLLERMAGRCECIHCIVIG